MTLVRIVTLTIWYAEAGGKNMSGVKKDRNEQSGIQDRKDPVIQVRHVSKIYPVEDDEPVRALDDVSLDIYPGEICCIFGASGSGKSTLLNQLAGLEKPEKGAIRIQKTILNALDEDQLAVFRQKHIGFVFQSYNLLPQMTALENVEMPLIFQGEEPEKRKKAARAMLARVGLEKRMFHYPRQMSGGQQQRTGIARALVSHPAIIFADEPTGNLDSKSSKQIMEMFQKFSKELHQTIVIVSHDPETAEYADHIVRLSDGRIVEEIFKEKQIL